ncbi:MAG: hypothetical protein ACOH1V_04200 [Stenotrophomonas sp.]
MKGSIRIVVPLGLLLALAPPAQALEAPSAKDATQSSYTQMPCLARSQISPEFPVPLLLASVLTCMDEDRVQDAVDLFNIAGVFDNFDRRRVADKSAHSVYAVMKMEVGTAMGAEQLSRFEAALRDQVSAEKAPAYVAEVCSIMKRQGPPTYTPAYMLKHGMAAFTGQGGGLVPDFNAAAEWQATLDNYLRCPA